MSTQESDSAGVLGERGPLGDGGLLAGKANMRLVARAIENGWNVPPEYKKLVVSQMAKIVAKSKSERDQIGASRILLGAVGQDLKLQIAKENQQQSPGNVFNGPVQVNFGEAIAAAPADELEALDGKLGRLIEAMSLPPSAEAGDTFAVRPPAGEAPLPVDVSAFVPPAEGGDSAGPIDYDGRGVDEIARASANGTGEASGP